MQGLCTIGDLLERRELDPEIREMFEAFSREESRWERDDDLPDSVTSRMFIAAVSWAMMNPKRWKAYYLHYYLDMEAEEIAAHLGHTVQYVRKLLRPVHYSAMQNAIVNNEEGQEQSKEA